MNTKNKDIAERLKNVKYLRKLTNEEIRLKFGELTNGELRAVRAAFKWVESQLTEHHETKYPKPLDGSRPVHR